MMDKKTNQAQSLNMLKPDEEDKLDQSIYNVNNTKKDEKHFCISIAGRIIEINSLYATVYEMCQDYLSEKKPEIKIYITENDINYEKTKAKGNEGFWKDDYLETLAVYRKISENLLDYDTILMHGAVIAYKNIAYMFTAVSGTGKTTHIRKWIENLEDANVVNGDKPLIVIRSNEAIACGTPWQGKEGLGLNCMVPLKVIVLMERGENNHIEEISFEKALAFLIRQTNMSEDSQNIKKTLMLVAKLKGRVKFYKYVFNNMKDDAFEVAYKGIVEYNT